MQVLCKAISPDHYAQTIYSFQPFCWKLGILPANRHVAFLTLLTHTIYSYDREDILFYTFYSSTRGVANILRIVRLIDVSVLINKICTPKFTVRNPGISTIRTMGVKWDLEMNNLPCKLLLYWKVDQHRDLWHDYNSEDELDNLQDYVTVWNSMLFLHSQKTFNSRSTHASDLKRNYMKNRLNTCAISILSDFFPIKNFGSPVDLFSVNSGLLIKCQPGDVPDHL